MPYEKVKDALQEYNKVRKKEIKIDHSQIKALKRFQEMKSYSKTYFPQEYVEDFFNQLMSASKNPELYRCRPERKRIEAINGVPTAVITQTKLTTVDEDEKIKKSP